MDASSIKKGPWTSEEDLILVTYIQQHGPRNWKYVPVNTGGQQLRHTLSRFYNTSSTYAASAENISRLLKSWTEPTSDSTATSCTTVVTSNANQEQGESALFDISQYESLDWNDNSSMFKMFGDEDPAGEIENSIYFPTRSSLGRWQNPLI